MRAEEEEKRRYMSLSDREKRALAAEKRLAAQYKDKGAAVPVIRYNTIFFVGLEASNGILIRPVVKPFFAR